MNNDESDETAKPTNNELKPIKPDELTIRLWNLYVDNAAKAYGNLPTIEESKRLASLWHDRHTNDQIDALKFAFDSTRRGNPNVYERIIIDEPKITTGKVWVFTYDAEAAERATANVHAEGGYIDADYVVVGEKRDCSTPALEPTDNATREALKRAATYMSQHTPWSYEDCYKWIKSQAFKETFGGSVLVHYDEIGTMTEEDWHKLFHKLSPYDKPDSKPDWTKGLERQRRHKPK